MASDEQPLADKVEQLGEISRYLFDLATYIHEHSEMLYRLSDNAKAEEERLRRQLDGADTGGPSGTRQG